MMNGFFLNNVYWRVIFVNPDSRYLVDRTGRLTYGTTDPINHTVYISNEITDGFLARVIIHEIGHCAIISFGLLRDIHRMVKPEHWIEAEEWVCNFIADYGWVIFSNAYYIIGRNAIETVPYEIERMITA